MTKIHLAAFFLVTIYLNIGFAYGEEIKNNFKLRTNDDFITFLGGVGFTFLRGEELVYDSTGNRLSELLWESEAPVLSGILHARLASPWTLGAGAAIGFAGNSLMTNHDWLESAPSHAFKDWSHHSLHPNTRLDHYVTGDVALGRDFTVANALVLNLHGGFKYTDVRWTATGGHYVYSGKGFRDITGTFPGDGPGVSYQQKLPGVFAGAQTTAKYHNWALSLQARGGLNVSVEDIDHHWARNLRFEDRFGTQPFMTLSGHLEYSVHDTAKLFFSGSYQHHFKKIGDMQMYALDTGELLETELKGAGIRFRSFTLSGGFTLAF